MAPLLSVRNLRKYFPVKGGIFGRVQAWVQAVDNVSFEVVPGETMGIVGESGCGKSTTARLIMRLIDTDKGKIFFEGKDVLATGKQELKTIRRHMQMVFQDSHTSLNPRMNIEDTVAFNLMVHGVKRAEARDRVYTVFRHVGLAPDLLGRRYPHELSGGQRQRVNIARALALEPKLLFLDEAVSALDKSIQAQVLNLLLDLKAKLGLTYIFISHDLNVIEYFSDRVMVMYLGQIVEVGTAQELSENPLHPYTRALFASAPSMDPDRRLEAPPITGDPPNPINPPTGCRFHTRCRFAEPECSRETPEFITIDATRQVACFLYDSSSKMGGRDNLGASVTGSPTPMASP